MNRQTRFLATTLVALSSIGLVGCAGFGAATGFTGAEGGSQQSDRAARFDARDRQARDDLGSAIAHYERGQYGEAIRALQTSLGIWAAPVTTQITAYKYLAFSQCVLNRRKACRESFDALLTLDPGFELAAAEAGHPQWGPVFKAAKAATLRARASR
jgi:hypothetical protein